MHEAVGRFVGADVLRALLALAEPNTCHNVELLRHAVVRGYERRLEEISGPLHFASVAVRAAFPRSSLSQTSRVQRCMIFFVF